MHMTCGSGPATEGSTTGQELIDAMRAGRMQLAKQYTVDRALGENGNVNAQALSRAMGRGAPLSDELKLIGRFAANAPKASGVPKEDPSIITKSDLATSLVSALFGHYAGAAIGAVRPALRYGLLSGPGQSLFASQAAPAAAGQVPLMVQGMPAAYAGVQSLFGQ